MISHTHARAQTIGKHVAEILKAILPYGSKYQFHLLIHSDSKLQYTQNLGSNSISVIDCYFEDLTTQNNTLP